MRQTSRGPLWILALLVLFGLCPAARAGTITFGGDLAGLLGGPVGTPFLLAGGTILDIPFSAALAGVGSVMGTVRLQNNPAATSGGIAINDFVFQSFRPSGSGPVSFTALIEQDYAYSGGPGSGGFNGGTFLNSVTTFTGFPQSATVAQCAAFQGSCPGPGGVGFTLTATPGGPFPQTVPFGFVGDAILPLTAPVQHLELGLALTLSDNAIGVGPRIANGPGGSVYSIGYSGPAAIPEPSTWTLLGIGLVALVAYGRRRQGSGAPPDA
jgi:hypothetical protein